MAGMVIRVGVAAWSRVIPRARAIAASASSGPEITDTPALAMPLAGFTTHG